MDEREIIIDGCVDICKALVNQTMSKYHIDYIEEEIVLKKIKEWIDWVLD